MKPIHIAEFEARLMTLREELTANINRLEEELGLIVAEDEINDPQDLASLESDNQHHNALLKQQRHELLEVEHALAKIAGGSYGLCEKSGEKIPLERLRAEPHTRYCIEHAREAGQ